MELTGNEFEFSREAKNKYLLDRPSEEVISLLKRSQKHDFTLEFKVLFSLTIEQEYPILKLVILQLYQQYLR